MSDDVIARLRGAGYPVKTRAEWGSKQAAVYATRLRTKPVDVPVPYLFAHITVTAVNGDAGARQVEQIGMDRFASGISYNWLVDHESHTIYEGQPLRAKGTHTVNERNVPGFPNNLNYFGHAVAFMAMPGDEFCDECAELFAAIQAAERIEGYAKDSAEFLPHSKFAVKDCPTDAVRNRLDAINKVADQMVRDGLAHEAKPTRVTRIKKQLAALAKELDKVPAKRRRVHQAADAIEAEVKKLPER